MIDISSERLLSLADAVKIVPGRPHIATVWRWVTHGCRGAKLETVSVGAKRFTSAAAIDRFIAATTAAANGEPAPTRTPRERRRAVAKAKDKLAKAGI